MPVGVCVLLPLGLLRWLRQHPSWRGRFIEKWEHQVLLHLALWVQEKVGGQDLGIRQGISVHMWQAHWLGVQGQDQALGRRQPEVQRTLGYQGPKSWAGGEGWTLSWLKTRILGGAVDLDPGGRTKAAPQIYNSGQPQDKKTQLRASWVPGLDCDTGNRGPFSSKQA